MGGLSLELDPSGGVLDQFIALNNQVLEGVHTFPGGDQVSTHGLDVDYADLLPKLFGLGAGNFYMQLASEPGRSKF